jgi:hypothetical protein
MRRMYETLATTHRAGEPIYANDSDAAPLDYYFPRLRPDLHASVLETTRGGGWYVQRGRFRPIGADLVMRDGTVVLARVPSPPDNAPSRSDPSLRAR